MFPAKVDSARKIEILNKHTKRNLKEKKIVYITYGIVSIPPKNNRILRKGEEIIGYFTYKPAAANDF